MGIEPTRPAWKAGVLPLNYIRNSYRILIISETAPIVNSILKKNYLTQRFIKYVNQPALLI